MFPTTKKSILFGIGGGAFLLVVYFLILALTQSTSHVLEQFKALWYLILPLVIGFGVQVFLYSYIRYQTQNQNLKAATGEIAATGGISTGSMIACCAHHLVDVLPVLGLTAAFLFLAKYQAFFLLLGISSNIFGILMMLEIIKKNNLGENCRILKWLSKYDLKKIKIQTAVILALILLVSFFVIKNQGLTIASSSKSNFVEARPPRNLEQKINEAGGLKIEVKLLDFSFEKPVQFEIKFTTHQGDLDFDLIKKAVLIDDKNNQYLPLEWTGGKGGHHLSGTLVFPKISEAAKSVKLIINNIYAVKERIFEWDMR